MVYEIRCVPELPIERNMFDPSDCPIVVDITSISGYLSFHWLYRYWLSSLECSTLVPTGSSTVTPICELSTARKKSVPTFVRSKRLDINRADAEKITSNLWPSAQVRNLSYALSSPSSPLSIGA